ALAVPADIYFLDEPTVGLDPLARRDVWSVLRELSKQSLIFLTTHYMEEAETLSDLVIMINRGKIVEIGTPRELLGQVKYRYKVVVDKSADLSEINKLAVETDKEKLIYVESNSELTSVIESLLSRGLDFSIKATSLEDLFIMKVRGSGQSY
ncbi:MAG: hypothetical protein LM569_03030, partial [Desulfurococcaceae archaeon]|nr:hypothetical protein [Desulfurococcaceae archaeon]